MCCQLLLLWNFSQLMNPPIMSWHWLMTWLAYLSCCGVKFVSFFESWSLFLLVDMAFLLHVRHMHYCCCIIYLLLYILKELVGDCVLSIFHADMSLDIKTGSRISSNIYAKWVMKYVCNFSFAHKYYWTKVHIDSFIYLFLWLSFITFYHFLFSWPSFLEIETFLYLLVSV